MKLAIATNWDPRIAELARDYPVYNVFGALDRDPLGGGMPAAALPRISRKRLADHIGAVREAGASFSYLLNAPCLGNQEYTTAGQRRIGRFLAFLEDVGVDYVTVTIPYLMEMVRAYAPSLKIRVSTIAQTNTVEKARFFDRLGVDEIALEFSINRDFALLKAIREAVSCDLSLLCNELCLQSCPWSMYHYNMIGHASRDGEHGAQVDTCTLSCRTALLKDPVELLKSPNIRPEDVARYEALGYEHFKLAGRNRSTEYLETLVRAYSERRFDGNLLDLCANIVRRFDDRQQGVVEKALAAAPNAMKAVLSVGAAVLSLVDRSDLVNKLDYVSRLPAKRSARLVSVFGALWKAFDTVHVDNRALDGFLERFESVPCADCADCPYCGQWTRRAVRIDREAADRAVAEVEAFLKDLARGAA